VIIKDDDWGTVTLPTVSIWAADPSAGEPDNPGKIVISRIGDLTQDLQVSYEIVTDPIEIQPPPNSTPVSPIIQIPAAENGVDDKKLPGSVTLTAGADSVGIAIEPIDDQLVEGPEHVTLQLLPSSAYNINQPDAATVVIQDNDPANVYPVVEIVAPKNGEGFAAPADIRLAAQASDANGIVKTVEFFANGKSLGVTTANPMSASAVNPFQLDWTSVPAGQYVLMAKATDDFGAVGVSEPVKIVVIGPTPKLPVVTIEAAQPLALESDPAHPAVLTVTRTGSLETKLNVRYTVAGTAQNGVDYQPLSGMVTIEAGQSSAVIQVVPIPDKALEGKETVIVTLTQMVFAQPIAIFPPAPEDNYTVGSPGTATVVIDDQSPNEHLQLAITSPANGASFNAPANIPISATAIDPKGYISRVEFFANDVRIGVSQVLFFRAPDLGTPVEHHYEWRNVPAGEYTLIAKAKDSCGALLASSPVTISVSPAVNPAPVKPHAMGHEVHVVFQDPVGQHYSIQVSSDLQNWTDVSAAQNAAGLFDYADPDVGDAAHRFYRAVPAP
jgi:Bacterial Ig domain/Calx-beta domain